MKKIIIAMILLSASHIWAAGNTYIFDHITRKDGLSNSSVSSIVQDRNGFLWFGTQGGLNRYDGKNFKVYSHDPYDSSTLPHRLIQTMHLDSSRNVIWIGTYDGFSEFDIDKETFTSYKHDANNPGSLSNEVVTSIAVDNDGFVWVGTLNGLNKFDPKTKKFEIYFNEKENEKTLSHNVVRSILVDSSGRIWIGGYAGLNLYDKKTNSFIRYNIDDYPGLESPYIMAMKEDSSGSIWIANWGQGIVKFDPDYGSFKTIKTSNEKIYTIFVEDGSKVWAGSWGGGLFEYDIKSHKMNHYSYKEENRSSIRHDVIYSIYVDETGIVWIGTNGNGINKLNRDKIDYRLFSYNPTKKLSLTRGKVNSILEDSSGDIWIGVYGGGINRYIKSQNRMVKYVHNPYNNYSLSNDIVTFIYEDSKKNIWIGTNKGLNRFNRNSGTFKRYYSGPTEKTLNGSIPYTMVEDVDGNYWIGTYKNGVDYWDISRNRFINYRNNPEDVNSISDNLIYEALLDSDRDIWFATNNGLNKFDRKSRTFKRYLHDPQNKESLSNNTIRTLFDDSDGILWVGTTSGGLNKFDKKTGKFNHYDMTSGMSDNAVYGIMKDEKGNLWISTSYGINIFNQKTNSFDILSTEDGLWGMEFNIGHAKGKDGSMYFGSMHGVYVFKDTPETKNQHKPPVKFVDIQVMNKPLESEVPYYKIKKLRLPYNNNFISFEFVGIDYVSPAKNQYAYKISGISNDWIYTGTRNYISFSNLDYGDYTLTVKAANSDGVWNDEGASIDLIIDPPPWKSWWAYMLYVIGGISMIYLFAEIKSKRVLETKIEELEDTRAKLQSVNKQLQGISVKDSLTGVYNRRYLDKKMEAEWQHAAAVGSYIAMIIIDIDYFKRYNDNYGHQAGDEALISVAKILETIPGRRSDFLSRYGGEEFCIVLPDVDPGGVRVIAEKCLNSVRSLEIKHEYSHVSDILTISLGYGAIIPGGDDTVSSFFKKVDEALYVAKETGRNRASEINNE